MPYTNIREEELKNKVASRYFSQFDATKIIGNVDFCVSLKGNSPSLSHSTNTPPSATSPLVRGSGGEKSVKKGSVDETETQSLLWAEAKRGKSDIYTYSVNKRLDINCGKVFYLKWLKTL